MMSDDEYRIIVIHDNPKWFPLVKEALEGYGVILDQWMPDEMSIDLTSAPPKNVVFYNRCSPTGHTRGHALAIDQAHVILRWLRRHGAVVVNGLPAIEIEDSKAYQYVMAQECGIEIPKTIFTSKLEADVIVKHFGTDTPFVIKPDRGGYGIDIKMYHNISEFEADKEPLGSFTGMYLIQSYIPPTSGLFRIEFVNQKLLYVSKALMCDGFSSNFCPNDLPEDRFQILRTLDDPVIDKCKKLFSTPDLHNGGIEFLFADDGVPYLIDLNCNTVYNTKAEIEAGVPQGWQSVAEDLYTKLQDLKKRNEQNV